MPSHLLWSLLGNLALGGLLGAVGGLFGIGGGLIAIPVLGSFYGMDQQLAQGTALAMVAPNVVIGFWRYRQRNDIEWSAAAYIAVPAMVITYFGARFASGLNPATLHFSFAVFVAVLAVYFLWVLSRRHPALRSRIVLPKKYLSVVGALGGAISGFFSVGGGIVSVPALVAFFGASQTAAQGLGLALALPGTLIALWTYAHAGHVDWTVGAPLAVGGVLSISAGVALAHRLPERRLRILFCGGLIVLALWMMIHG
jgi:uncharacterized membrane protein YfcA